jgi:hypothetical protein
MSNEKLGNGEKDNTKTEQNKNQNNDKVAKITITKESELLLDEMVSKVNDGFTGGKVTRQDVASWVIRYFHGQALAHCLEEIRADHFDQLAHFEALLRQAREAKRSGADAGAIAVILGKPNTASPTKEARRRVKKSDDTEVLAS